MKSWSEKSKWENSCTKSYYQHQILRIVGQRISNCPKNNFSMIKFTYLLQTDTNILNKSHIMFIKKQFKACSIGKIRSSEIKNHRSAYDFRDIFCVLLELRWRWIFSLYTLLNLISWILFALCWWLVAQYHGDLPDSDSGNEESRWDWAI